MSEFLINSTTLHDQQTAAVTGLSNGGFVIIWQSWGQDGSKDGIFAQRYNERGLPVYSNNGDYEFQINTTTSQNQRFPAITTLDNGEFVAVWQSEVKAWDSDAGKMVLTGYDVYGQRFNKWGRAKGGEFKIAENVKVDPLTADQHPSDSDSQTPEPTVNALTNGGFVVAWQSYNDALGDGHKTDIYARLYDESGNAVLADNENVSDEGYVFRVNSETFQSQQNQAVAALSDGGFVAAWHSWKGGDRSDIIAQRFDASGKAVGGEFVVNFLSRGGDQFSPSVTGLSDGGFVITWEGLNQNDSNLKFEIYGQRYNQNGDRVGNEFQINTYTDNHQLSPSVAELADGGIVVVWRSVGQDGSDFGVYGQQFDIDGRAFKDEFRVNSTTEGAQNNPWVTALDGGGFVVVWESEGQDGSRYGIYGQRYDNNGNKIDDGLRIDATKTTAGDDILIGDEGQDTFIYSSNHRGKDTITDFDLAEDKLDLSDLLPDAGENAVSIDAFLNFSSTSNSTRTDTIIDIDVNRDGNVDQSITLRDVDLTRTNSSNTSNNLTSVQIINNLLGNDGTDNLDV